MSNTLGKTYQDTIGVDFDKPTYKYRFSLRNEALQDTISDIISIINTDRFDPFVRQKAIDIIKQAGVQDRDKYGMIKAVYDYLQKTVSYVEDPKDIEFMQRTQRLLDDTKAGDCDDFTISGASLLLSLNVDVRLKIVGTESPNYFNHIYLQANDGNKWVDFDPIYLSRQLGQAPTRILTERIFEIAPISSSFNNQIPAVILNGDKKMQKDNLKNKIRKDLGFYNNLLGTLAGYFKATLSNSIPLSGKGDPKYTEAVNFFDHSTAPRIGTIEEIPEEVIEEVVSDPALVQDYKTKSIALENMANKPELMGYLAGVMLDGYTGLHGWFGNKLRNFFRRVGSGLKKGFSAVRGFIRKGIKRVTGSQFVRSALSFIPGVGPIVSKGMNALNSFLNRRPQMNQGMQIPPQVNQGMQIPPQMNQGMQIPPQVNHESGNADG